MKSAGPKTKFVPGELWRTHDSLSRCTTLYVTIQYQNAEKTTKSPPAADRQPNTHQQRKERGRGACPVDPQRVPSPPPLGDEDDPRGGRSGVPRIRPSVADKSLGTKGLVSADRSEDAALLCTTPRSIPKSSASDFAPLSTAECYPRSRARSSYSPDPECAGFGLVPSWR